jgi:hypothetical protein
MTAFLKSAYELAALGYAVFQCAPKLKSPFYLTAPHGCNSATTDLIIVTKNWTQYPDCNIGIKCANLLVLDLDCKAGIDGTNDLRNVISSLGKLPDCPLVRTGSGGWHLFFARPEVDVIGTKHVVWQGKKTGIDIQVGNQYVVAPPSIHPNGQIYTWQNSLCKVADLPKLPQRWIDEFLSLRKINQNKITNVIVPTSSVPTPSVPTPSNSSATVITSHSNYSVIERCRAYISEVAPCISGQGGDKQLFKVASIIFWDFGLSETEGMPILEEYNQRCIPTWNKSRLQYKMQAALNYQHEKTRGYLLDNKNNHNVDLSELKLDVICDDSTRCHSEFEVVDGIEHLIEVPPIPFELFRVQGFIGEVMDYCLENASYPIPAMAFAGALALQSFLCGRKVREPGDLRTNLYILALANASSGKDYVRKVIKSVAREIGASYGVGDKFTSGQAIEDSLLLNPNLLFLCDEFDAILNSIKKGKDSTNDMIVSTLLTLYTSANTFYDRRRKADIKKIEQINQPHLTLFGTATPKNYYASLSSQMLEGGFFARMIVLDAGKRPKGQDANPPDGIIVQKRIIETAKWWYEFEPSGGNLSNVNPTPAIVPFNKIAKDEIRQYREYTENEYSKAEVRGDTIAMTVWGRAAENATKLALLAACSESYNEPIIQARHTSWAVNFNSHQVRRALFLAAEYAAETDFDVKIKKAIQELRKWHCVSGNEQPMPEWKLKRKLGLSPSDFDAVASDLVRRRLVKFETYATKGRPLTGFKLDITE